MNAILHRSADFQPESFNADDLTVDAVISTFADNVPVVISALLCWYTAMLAHELPT